MRKSVSGLYREIEDAQIQFRFGLQCHGCPVLRSSDENPNDGEYFFSWAYLTFFMLSRWGSKCKVASESFLHVPPLLWTVIPLKDQDSHLPFPFGLQIYSLCRTRYVTFKPNRRIFKRSTPRSLQHDLKNRYQVCLAAYLSHSLGFSAVHEVSSCCNHLFKTITSKQFTRNACPHLQEPISSHYILDLQGHPPCKTVSGLPFLQNQFAAQKRLPAVAYQKVKLSLQHRVGDHKASQ